MGRNLDTVLGKTLAWAETLPNLSGVHVSHPCLHEDVHTLFVHGANKT